MEQKTYRITYQNHRIDPNSNLPEMEDAIRLFFKAWIRSVNNYRRFRRYSGNVSWQYQRGIHPSDAMRHAYIHLLGAIKRRTAYINKEKTYLCPVV